MSCVYWLTKSRIRITNRPCLTTPKPPGAAKCEWRALSTAPPPAHRLAWSVLSFLRGFLAGFPGGLRGSFFGLGRFSGPHDTSGAGLGPGASGTAELEQQRRTDQPERGAETRGEESQIVRRNVTLDVGEERQARRRMADLSDIHQLEPPPPDHRRIHRGGGFGQHAVKLRGLESRAPRIDRLHRGGDDLVNAVAGQGRGEQHFGEGQKRHLLLRVAPARRDPATLL